MMDHWTLPKTLEVGGKSYPIRYQYSAVLDILAAYEDPDLDDDEKTEILLTIMYPDYPGIPKEYLPEAVCAACDFIDCGQKDEGKAKPKLVDWERDADIIIPAINKVAGREVRLDHDLHWWTFWGYFMSIGESLFSTVLHIRKKKSTGKKLDKWEEEFLKENRSLIVLKKRESEEERLERERFLAWLES